MSQMRRVSPSNPCVICKKGDWCLAGADLVICMRIQSSRVKHFSDGSVGFLHNRTGAPLPESHRAPAKERPIPIINFSERLDQWRSKYGSSSLTYLARKLGITEKSLELTSCTKHPQHGAWCWPMRDGKNHIIGIRIRHENGSKWSETGSQNGLFLPQIEVPKEIAICEGPTDTAAALSIGLYAIGRFNCCGGIHQIQEFIKNKNVKRITIIADVDQDRVIEGRLLNPGIRGAEALQEHIGIPSCILTLPSKDMRQFVASGGSLDLIKSLTSQLVWNNPRYETRK